MRPVAAREQLAAKAMRGQPGKQPWAVADGVLGVEVLADRLQLSRCLLRELGRQDEVSDAFVGEDLAGQRISRRWRVDAHQQHRRLSGDS